MKSIWMWLAAIFIALAWLLPVHYRPWVTYTGDAMAFLALFALTIPLFKQRLQVPKISLPLLLLMFVPLLQCATGELFFFSKALVSSCYIFAFWLSIVVAYNLSLAEQRPALFAAFCELVLYVAALSGVIAVFQWLTIDQYFPGFMADLRSGRPYANFAQPNNMATFLILGVLSALYLYERKQLALGWLIPSVAVILFAIALSQSRTSWVALLCIVMYMGYQRYRGLLHIHWRSIALCAISFVAFLWLIPQISAVFAEALDAPIKAVDLARRATGDMSRMAIWNQMLHAIAAEPWWGYGWHQTSVAYTLISDTVQGPVWIKSAHNFVLDFALWNGLVIAVPFLAYFAYWMLRLHLNIRSLESVVAMLMLGAILTHAMLEFPLFYAYFLLPFGFLIGVLQAQKDGACWSWSPRFTQLSFVVGAVIMLAIHRDYVVVGPKLSQSIKYDDPAKWTNNKPIYLLSEFDRRIAWVRLNPYTHVSPEHIQQIDEMVLNYPIPYDLLKYARLLAYNGYEQEAKHQLLRLKLLRDLNVSYESLIEEQPKP